MEFCASADLREHLAVLGIFSSATRAEFRREIRSSWMPDGPPSRIVPRFVLRGVGASSSTINESHVTGDIVFMEAPSSMDRASGPLQTLLLWYHCAVTAWPNALLIGKADDDVWLHLPSVAMHAYRSIAALQAYDKRSSARLMYWGQMETYHWSEETHKPIGFGWHFRQGERCRVQAKTREGATRVVGPFHYVVQRQRPAVLRGRCLGRSNSCEHLRNHRRNARHLSRQPHGTQ